MDNQGDGRDWARLRRETPYQRWQKAEGIPTNRGVFMPDLHTLEVAPWPRFGQQGAFVNLADQEEDDGYVLEIAPARQTEVQHHLFEAMIYVLSGRGATTIWQKGGRKQTVEWQRGSVFSPPLNAYYQHFNLDGQLPTRMFAVTNNPMVLNIFHNPRFVFGDEFAFDDRYDGADDYFTDPGHSLGGRGWKTNFIADVRSFHLEEWAEHGAGSILSFEMSNNGMAAHIMEWPTGTYPKAHRHNVGAHVIILDGVGYSLLWFEGRERETLRVDWRDGTVLSPREMEYHQHFNTGPTNARCLAFRLGALDSRPAINSVSWMKELNGIPYETQDPHIYAMFGRECARNGATVYLPRPEYVGARSPR